MSNKLDNNLSMLGHLRNQLVKAIHQEVLLPKAVVVILDDNLVSNITHNVLYVYGIFIHWLASEFNKIVESHKDILPKKAKKMNYPTFIWIALPTYCNFDNNHIRQKLSASMKTTLEIQKQHIMLKMLKIWEFSDRNAYRDGHYTQIGFEMYWKSIDLAIQFWDTNLVPKGVKVNTPSR